MRATGLSQRQDRGRDPHRGSHASRPRGPHKAHAASFHAPLGRLGFSGDGFGRNRGSSAWCAKTQPAASQASSADGRPRLLGPRRRIRRPRNINSATFELRMLASHGSPRKPEPTDLSPVHIRAASAVRWGGVSSRAPGPAKEHPDRPTMGNFRGITSRPATCRIVKFWTAPPMSLDFPRPNSNARHMFEGPGRFSRTHTISER